MEAFQIGIKNLPVDKYRAVKAVDCPGIAGKLQQLLVRKASTQVDKEVLKLEIPKIHEGEYRFCLILWKHEPVTAAQLAKLVRDFFHGFDDLIVVFHNLIPRFL